MDCRGAQSVRRAAHTVYTRVERVSGVSIPESERAERRGGFLTLVYRKSVRENVVVCATRL